MGSKKKYTVNVDVLQLYEDDAEEVEILESNSNSKHQTRIEINLRKTMRGTQENTLKK